MNISKWAALITLFSLLLACGETEQQASVIDSSDTGRWYTAQQLDNGAQVFGANCAVCHGDQAQGLTADWQSRQADGAFPPPPLNGSAHAWHHPVSVLLGVIEAGGEDLGGKMPAFESVLSQDERMAAIAYFQSFWSDDTYLDWEDMGGVN
jgi:mono/diheme cytochrome c family protein